MPLVEKLAVVLRALALPKVTVPGPLIFDQLAVQAEGGLGRPSSLIVPTKPPCRAG